VKSKENFFGEFGTKDRRGPWGHFYFQRCAKWEQSGLGWQARIPIVRTSTWILREFY